MGLPSPTVLKGGAKPTRSLHGHVMGHLDTAAFPLVLPPGRAPYTLVGFKRCFASHGTEIWLTATSLFCIFHLFPFAALAEFSPGAGSTVRTGGHRCELGWGLQTGLSFTEPLLREGKAKP